MVIKRDGNNIQTSLVVFAPSETNDYSASTSNIKNFDVITIIEKSGQGAPVMILNTNPDRNTYHYNANTTCYNPTYSSTAYNSKSDYRTLCDKTNSNNKANHVGDVFEKGFRTFGGSNNGSIEPMIGVQDDINQVKPFYFFFGPQDYAGAETKFIELVDNNIKNDVVFCRVPVPLAVQSAIYRISDAFGICPQ